MISCDTPTTATGAFCDDRFNVNNNNLLKKKNPLILEKIIYAKEKKYQMSAEKVNEVLDMEVAHHLRNNPGLHFVKCESPVTNADLSITYVLRFEKIPYQPPAAAPVE